MQGLEELEFDRGLWSAAMEGNVDRLRELIGRGKNVNETDTSGFTALHYAARSGYLEACKYLVLNGANVNSKTQETKVTPLHRAAYCARDDICKFLISKGSKISEQDSDGLTPLHKAVIEHNKSTVQLLISLGADNTIKDAKNKIPSDYTEDSSILSLLQ
eukprot:TRINITY_DN10742_c0_g1_i1.p1 TRINITY_DN10742_c0_g1~~TRINITY_DN10742_c0_g1_i1.p1  ORF type:complete len:160 (-),score=33.40 TRINITY_DN10742_c0_g1_i1:125-604(-)